jgi:glutamine synthetase type III
MSGSVSRLQAVSAVTNYKPISEPLNFAETPAKALFGVNVFSQAVMQATLPKAVFKSLKKTIEALAAKEGYSVSQFLASAAGEKLAVVMTIDYLRREAAAGRREDFEKYLAAVPDVPAQPGDEL